MKTKLLVSKLLESDHFLRSTSEAGLYIGQPYPNSSNTGQMRPISSGDENDEISDFTYTAGEATANGSQTTLVDSKLRVFGDSILVGVTMTLTSGASSGTARKITSFTSAVGTLTWSGDVASTQSGDSYSLTLDHSNRSFALELGSGGDVGDAGFYWSHDGSQFFGREEPVTAAWKAGTTITTEYYNYFVSSNLGPTPPYTTYAGFPVLQANNGDLIALYSTPASPLLVAVSSDNGLSWEVNETTYTAESGTTVARMVIHGLVLKSGRILASGGLWGIKYTPNAAYSTVLCSDDNGQTWRNKEMYASDTGEMDQGDLIELYNGNLLCIENTLQNYLDVRISTDKGTYWGDKIQIRHGTYGSATSFLTAGDLQQMDNGNILFVYWSNETTPFTTYEIRSCLSTDGGGTWSAPTVIADSSNNLIHPKLEKDVNGDIYCAFVEQVVGAGCSICFIVSSDNGVNWGASRVLASNNSHTLFYPHLNTINGHEIICSYIDTTTGVTAAVFNRIGRSFDTAGTSVVPITCAPNVKKHRLVNDVAIQWYGGNGAVSDYWTFQPEHYYASENIIADSPGKVWRSTADNVACELIIDMGVSNSLFINGAALFDCNINTCSIEVNSSDSWSSPLLSTLIDFTEAAGTVDSVTDQYIKDTSLLSSYSDHELAEVDRYITMTSGTSVGTTYGIADNVQDYIILDTTRSHRIAIADTFNIYNRKVYKEILGFPTPVGDRWIRIYIPAQKTAEGYYQIGTAIIGCATTFNNTFADNNYSRDSDYNIELIKSLSGTVNPVVNGDRKQKWSVTWQASETSRKQVQAAITHARGKNIAFIPDWFVPAGGSKSSTTDVYLVKQTGAVRESFRYKNRWDLSAEFEENI